MLVQRADPVLNSISFGVNNRDGTEEALYEECAFVYLY